MQTSRRNFLHTAGAAATGLLVAATSADGQQIEAGSKSVPQPIARLKSRTAEALPISSAERQLRIERAWQLMGQNKIDAVLMIGGTSLVYFSNIHWWLSERLFAMVLPRKGTPFYVCPAFEEDRAREQVAGGPGGPNAELRLWHEDESPYQRVAEGLRDRGLTTGRLGIEETVRQVYTEGVAKAAPGMQIVSATPVTAGCRMIKSPYELQLMKLANQVTLAAYEAAYLSTREGMTQHDFADLVAAAHRQQGFQGGAGVQVGENSALPHGSAKPQVIREGTILLMDGGCTIEGYESDISRTVVLGKPTDKMKKNFEIVHRAQQAALAAAKPGVQCQAVDAAARKVIIDAGYGPDYKFFSHRLGHGIGMDGHEWPYLVRGNTQLLEPNMCFSDEPGIYIRGEFGVRLEDDMYITEHGAELFTPPSPSLESPFGK
ncbi:MAG TPA: Xaa-Pro peptidase family protein [Candidatus Saccharimonadales bacterium]|jgi:Xaa-Pro dipeptidase|nr:Xaa-Pro peptidase family protein [Candidatus Saccharimonadales bacterium]